MFHRVPCFGCMVHTRLAIRVRTPLPEETSHPTTAPVLWRRPWSSRLFSPSARSTADTAPAKDQGRRLSWSVSSMLSRAGSPNTSPAMRRTLSVLEAALSSDGTAGSSSVASPTSSRALSVAECHLSPSARSDSTQSARSDSSVESPTLRSALAAAAEQTCGGVSLAAVMLRAVEGAGAQTAGAERGDYIRRHLDELEARSLKRLLYADV